MESNYFFREEQPKGIHISEAGKSYLLEATRWAKFLAIIGFVVLGLGCLSMLSAMFGDATAYNPYGVEMGMIKGLLAIVLIFTLIFIYPCYTLFRFAAIGKRALLGDDSIGLESAFNNLKRTFKFWGIYAIILLLFYGMILVFAITVAATASI